MMESILILLVFAYSMMGFDGISRENQILAEMQKGLEANESILVSSVSSYPVIASVPTGDLDAFFIDSENIYCVYNGKKYGFIKEDGTYLTSDCIYDTASPFHQGLACVSIDGHYGYIDRTGTEVIPLVYDYAAPFAEGLAYFVKGEQYGFLDISGKTAFYLDCDSVSSFQEGLAFYSIDGKYGYLNQSGKTVIAPSYDDAGYFCNGFAQVGRDGWRGIIGLDGKEVIEPTCQEVGWNTSFLYAVKDQAKYYFDRTGNLLLESVYDSVTDQYSYFTYPGRKKLGDEFDKIRFSEEAIYFCKNGKYGIADFNGTVLIDAFYDEIVWIPQKGLAKAKKGDWYGIIDSNGEEKIPFLYQVIRYEADTDLFVVQLEEKWGACNGNDFSVQIPILYDKIEKFAQKRAVAVLDGIYQVIDQKGNLVFSVSSDQVLVRTGECYELYKKDNSYWILDKDGNKIFSAVYESYYRSYLHSNIHSMKQGDDEQEKIIKTGEGSSLELSKLLLRNEITPRVSEFYQLVHNEGIRVKEGSGNYFIEQERLNGWIKNYRLYDLEHSGQPILYYFVTPYVKRNFPYSCSGFYSCKEGEWNELVLGYECGGSLRGDRVRFYRDTETQQMLLGAGGYWGGWGGYLLGGEVYAYQNGESQLVNSFYQKASKGVAEEYSVKGEAVGEEEYLKVKEQYQEVVLIEWDIDLDR